VQTDAVEELTGSPALPMKSVLIGAQAAAT
jgi:hypothetical protein